MKKFSIIFLLLFAVLSAFSQAERIQITSIIPSENTGQNFAPWLNDNLDSLVGSVWTASNFKYIDVTLKLASRTAVSKIALYDYAGVFVINPAYVYAQDGQQKTLIGMFTGLLYKSFVYLNPSQPIMADAIVIHKFCNNIPQKVQVYGQKGQDTVSVPPVIVPPVSLPALLSFPYLTNKTAGDAPFNLLAASSNTITPIDFTSSNPAVVSVANIAGVWKATPLSAGQAIITASQVAGNNYLAALSITKTQIVLPAVSNTTKYLPGKIEAETFNATSGVGSVPTLDAGGGSAVTNINNNDWLSYKVVTASAATYHFNFRVSSFNASGKLEVRSGNGTVLQTVSIPHTGGLQNYQTVSADVSLVAGLQTLNLYIKNGGWNLNWFEATLPVATIPAPTDTASEVKITIDPKRWYQLNNTSNTLEALFDSNTSTGVSPSWGLIFSNFDAYYPVRQGEEINITGVKFFDGQGTYTNAPLTLSIINDQWQKVPIATFTGKDFNKWVGAYPDRTANGGDVFKLDAPVKNARFLVINTSVAYPTEIELYGSYTPAPALAPLVRNPATLKEALGVNAFEWDFENPSKPMEIDESRMNALKAFGGVRHYMDWQKLELTEGKYTFNPVHSGGWNYDAIYERCKAENIEVLPCLKTLPDWMKNTYPYGQQDMENVPLKYGRDYADPASYIEQAKVGFQYIARYGNNPNVDLSLLSVNSAPRWGTDAINVVKRGMGVIKYIECENERDKWWKGRKAYQTGREYAAELSAFYDGNKNTMGAGVGVKNADPGIKVVMGGVARTSTDYLKGMIDWCRQYRGYNANGTINLCWDIINYHLYPNDAKSSQGGYSTRGAAPEVSEAKNIANAFLQVAHEFAHDMPVWITETGYDVNQGSPLKAIQIGNKSVLQTQADWTLRTALLYAREGVQKVFFYQLYDDNPTSTIKFSSMGLINNNKTRKPAADFIYQTKKLFGEYSYKETLNSDPIVDRYELNGNSVYSLVVPDEKGRSADFELDMNNADSAIIYTPAIGSDDMTIERVKLKNGKLSIKVTETPIFVKPVGAGTALKNSRASRKAVPAPEVLENSVKLYPNPATNFTNLVVENNELSPLHLQIIDEATGIVSKTFSLNKTSFSLMENINLSSLPNGMYTLQIVQGNVKTSRKFLKIDTNSKM